jgi:hypothetical protein
MITDAGSNPLVALDYNMTGWTLVDPDENVWGYDLTAEPNSTTSNLFSTISFSQALTEAQVAEMDGDPITVRAAGVQSEHIGSISEAWTAGFSGTFPTVP